jgi:sugar/nucleoside kinase (ribokinase family)
VLFRSGLYVLPRLREKLPALFRQLRSNGARISFDPGWNPNGFTRRAQSSFYKTLSYVDFYEPNDAELKQMTGERTVQSALQRTMKRFNGVLALKLGKRGSAIMQPGRKIIAPPFAAQVADTTGAGDAFDAGFIAGVVQDRTLEISAKMGNAVASITVSRRGKATLRFPRYRGVRSLMKGENAPSKN